MKTLFVAFALSVAGCAGHRAETRTAETEPRIDFVELQPSGPPTTPVQLRAELAQRRGDLMARCDAVVARLEDRRRDLGSVGSQVASAVTAQVAATLVQSGTVATQHGRPSTPMPVGAGASVAETIRTRVRISDIRAGMHDLATARTDRDVIDAIDRLAPKCAE